MLFYVQMRWNYRNGISHDELLELELEETKHARAGIESGLVKGIWKVASQHRVIVIAEAKSAEELDRNSMFNLPMREHIEFEAVWPLCDYLKFSEDLESYVDERRRARAAGASSLPKRRSVAVSSTDFSLR